MFVNTVLIRKSINKISNDGIFAFLYSVIKITKSFIVKNTINTVNNYFIQPIIFIASLFYSRQEGVWVFCSHYGYSNNAKYLFQYACKINDDIKPTWIATSKTELEELRSNNKNVKYAHSIEGIRCLLKSDVVLCSRAITDTSHWGAVFGATSVCLNHGVPLVNTTYKNATWIQYWWKKIIKNFDFFVVTGDGRGSEAYLDTDYYCLEHTNILTTGYPRTDSLFENDAWISSERSPELVQLQELSKNDYLISYLPTIRPESITNPLLDSDQALHEMQQLLEKLNAYLIVKLHPRQSNDESEQKSVERIKFVDRSIDANMILKHSDLLITDFSSVYLDYLLLDKPIIFFNFDIHRHRREYEYVFDYDEITPGPKAKNVNELLLSIKSTVLNPGKYSEQRTGIRNSFFNHNNGGSCERTYRKLKNQL